MTTAQPEARTCEAMYACRERGECYAESVGLAQNCPGNYMTPPAPAGACPDCGGSGVVEAPTDCGGCSGLVSPAHEPGCGVEPCPRGCPVVSRPWGSL